ncbi:MAG: J domain-containing protein [Marinobacter sp.]
MNCWDLLGIEPTSDRQRVEQAYQKQLKFASSDEVQRLEQAFLEATGGAPSASDIEAKTPPKTPGAQPEQGPEQPRELDAYSAQVTREVVIQVKALLNDSVRAENADVWKAILCEPPANQPALRAEIARRLESQLRPMAENGVFPASVTAFLGDWFEWPSLREAAGTHAKEQQPDDRHDSEPEMQGRQGEQDEQPPKTVNFWPAVIGWIIGLAILTSLFGGMGGG